VTDSFIERNAARVIVIDPEGAVLLQQIEGEAGVRSWITPGGGVMPGESYEEAARRELAEEVGLRQFELGRWVWRRTSVFAFRGVRYRQHERFFVARAPRFMFDHSGLEDIEVGVVLDHRWWSVDEIASAYDEVFRPRRLAELLRPLVAGHLPHEVIDTGD
jgi:ADP-ribose pyrophosphatase YjhB (NUDIX family)